MGSILTIEQLNKYLTEEDKALVVDLVKKAEIAKKRKSLLEEIAKLQNDLARLDSEEDEDGEFGDEWDYVDEIVKGFLEDESINDENFYGELKIGEIVKTKMRATLENASFPRNEIQLLQDKEYCKRELDLNFPLLSKHVYDENGYARYYKKPIYVGGEQFYLCSQWYKWQKPLLEKWLSIHKY